jgi:intraflagellar transport protein 172
LDEAVKTFSKRGTPSTEQALGTYRRLVTRILSRCSDEEGDNQIETMSVLRDVMYKVANQFRAQSTDKKLVNEVVDMLMAVHYQSMLYQCKTLGFRDLTAKCAITLLKYPDYIPQDKAFYQAGVACRDQGNINLAFLLLNKFVDIAEAIDAADPSFLDNSEFQEADAIPVHDTLPIKHYLVHEVCFSSLYCQHLTL